MKNYILLLLVCLSVNFGKAQTERPAVEGLLLQMRQLMQQFSQEEDAWLELDTLIFLYPGEQNAPFGVLPPAIDKEGLNEWQERLQESMEKMESGSWLDLSEFFRSFGEIQLDPLVPAPNSKPKPKPEDDLQPKKKRKVYRL